VRILNPTTPISTSKGSRILENKKKKPKLEQAIFAMAIDNTFCLVIERSDSGKAAD
jgi:hypothetical protein